MIKKGNIRNKKFLLILVAILIISLLSASGCQAVKQEPAGNQAEKPKVINVSYSIRPLNVPTIVALERKMFEEAFAKEGIEIKWHQLEGPATTEALAAKSIDIALSLNYVSAIISKAAGNDIKIISGFTKFPKGIGLVAAKDSGVAAVADLKGKKIALQKGTMLQEMLVKALKEANLNPGDVTIVDMDSTNGANALMQNQVDAAVLPDPLLMKTLGSGKAVLLRNAEGLILGQAVIAARSEFLQQYPEVASAFLQIHKQAVEWVGSNTEDALQISAEATGMELKAVNALYPKFDFSMEIDKSNQSLLKESAEFLKANQYIDQAVDPEALINDLVDVSYLAK